MSGRRDGFRVGNGGRRPSPGLTVISRRSPDRPLGLQDPAYITDTAHDFWQASQGQPWRSTMSAAELEASLKSAPELDELRAMGVLSRERYDGGARLMASWILEHYASHPQDVRLPKEVLREVGKAHPELEEFRSTAAWLWALAAANRVFDAHQVG
jgi:hypothetical protein